MTVDFEAIPRRSGARWFVRHGATTYFARGFTSKEQANAWIERHADRLDWRVGFVFRVKGDSLDTEIVSRAGVVAKP